ncbi:MAG TPA: type VII secretion integral membrane protein EccD [Jatrophihabitans sp.]|nr:type VII secretion integral membrane protein EccD [Jatrophihabitans sp.]
MSASVVSNSCRLTIISATLRVDLAVPVQIPVAELLSMVVASLGREAADRGAAEGGWVLQRGTEAPLDPSTTIAAHQLRDGDVLHLRTRVSRLPEPAFDDVLDAVATGVRERTARWHASNTVIAATTMAAAVLLVALAALFASEGNRTAQSATCGVGAVLLGLTATAVGRVYRQRGPALTAAGFGVAYAAACGATAVAGASGTAHFGAPQLVVAACAAAFAAAVLLVSVGAGRSGLVAVITLTVLTAVGAGVATLTTLTPAGTAAIVATAALAVSPLLPTAAFRISRLPLPSIPSDAADLRRDTSTVDSAAILGQAVRADQFLTGLVGGVALAVAGAAAVIGISGTSERVLAIVLGLICLLRARLFTGRAQRALLLIAGAAALLAVWVAAGVAASGLGRVVAFAIPAIVVGIVLLALAVVLPDRRYAPPWARTADLVESLLVLSVIPLALAVMGVYGAIRVAAS